MVLVMEGLHFEIAEVAELILNALFCCSTFGNVLTPTCNVVEVVFSIGIVLGGLTLFTIQVGKIQVSFKILLAFSNLSLISILFVRQYSH